MDETLRATKLYSELVLKPIIKELVRTQVCFPNLKLLVDRISIVTLPSTDTSLRSKAYRLYLTDGEKSIQALLKRKIHKLMTDLDVREGTYIILKTYRLARGKRLNGRGTVIYIVIEDFYPIGEEKRDEVEIKYDRYSELIRTPQNKQYISIDEKDRGTRRRLFSSRESKSQQGQNENEPNKSTLYDTTPESLRSCSGQMEETLSRLSQAPFSPSSPITPSPNSSKKRDEPFEEIDPNLTPRPTKTSKFSHSPIETNKFTRSLSQDKVQYSTTYNSAVAKHLEESRANPNHGINDAAGMVQNTSSNISISKIVPPNGDNKQPITSTKAGTKGIISPSKESGYSSPKNSSTIRGKKPLLPIKRPMNIRSLNSVTGPNASRNKVYDFFAVICSVEESVVKPPMMPLKRDMRIMDPSTDKKVTLSVFVNPQNFKPSVGTIALFRSLTTHEWDRGMLNAYPQQCEGKDWFIINPVDIEGCDVQGIREWWEKKSAEIT